MDDIVEMLRTPTGCISPSKWELAAADEIERLRNAVELAEKVFSKLERGGMPSVSYGEVIGVLRRALRKRS